jgi:hypothetical protein
MSSHCNPSVVDDGLVFLYDVEDIQSYKGEPTTNLITNSGTSNTGWVGYGWTGSQAISNDYPNTYEFTATNGWHNRTFDTGITSGGTIYVSFQYKLKQQQTTQNQIFVLNGTHLGSYTNYIGNGSMSFEWQTFSGSFTANANSSKIAIGPRGQDSSGLTDIVYIRNLQVEQKPHSTPFVNGTRSATQGLLDRTGDRAIDLSNVSFDSNAEMIFDGTDDYISIPTYTFGNGSWTLNMWVNVSAFANYNLMSNSSGGPVANVFGAHGSNPKIFYMNYDGAWKDHYGNLTLTTNNWYFLTWVNYEGASASAGTMKMYVNGVADSDVFNSYITNGGPCNVIGKRWGGTSFNGKISQVSINTKSLSDPEILRNFNATKSRFGL